jgi:hypothetical protein
MLLGAGLTLAAWWPMLLLIGRSTRVLHLAAAGNDIPMPYGRLLALVIPGIDGWPDSLGLAGAKKFFGYPSDAYFWDTASYAGILPLVAIAAMAVRCATGRRLPELRWTFLAALSLAAFVCALPFASPLVHALPGTVLRSPARLMYICTFGAALATGAFIDWLSQVRRAKYAALILFAAQVGDLGRFCTLFVHVDPRDESPPEFQAIIDREAGDARIAEPRTDELRSNDDRHDDAGGFDSIFLANSYRGILQLAGLAPSTNLQIIDAMTFPPDALRMMGVGFVITSNARPDMQLRAAETGVNLYRIEDALARASLTGGGVDYQRPSSDEILLHTRSSNAGVVRILESSDPGWSATVDGLPTTVQALNDPGMAVRVPAGDHSVRLVYKTPGRAFGALMSLVSLAGLVLLVRR